MQVRMQRSQRKRELLLICAIENLSLVQAQNRQKSFCLMLILTQSIRGNKEVFFSLPGCLGREFDDAERPVNHRFSTEKRVFAGEVLYKRIFLGQYALVLTK